LEYPADLGAIVTTGEHILRKDEIRVQFPMAPSMIRLCPSCVIQRFTVRQLITAVVMNPMATTCKTANLHKGP
jgi:hypothetical protein